MLKRTLLAALVLGSSGCSFLLMNRPPEIGTQPAYPIECTTNQVAPVLDALGGGLLAATTVGVLVQDCTGQSCSAGSRVSGAILTGLLTTALVGSSVSGFRASSRCNRVQAQSQACVDGLDKACAALTWDPRTSGRRAAAPPAAPAAPAKPAGACASADDCDGGACIDGACRR